MNKHVLLFFMYLHELDLKGALYSSYYYYYNIIIKTIKIMHLGIKMHYFVSNQNNLLYHELSSRKI